MIESLSLPFFEGFKVGDRVRVDCPNRRYNVKEGRIVSLSPLTPGKVRVSAACEDHPRHLKNRMWKTPGKRFHFLISEKYVEVIP